MNKTIQRTLKSLAVLALLVVFSSGCGKTDDDGASLQDIPHYPNATEGESMQQSSFGGLVGGQLEQYTTTDSFDEVIEFYSNALESYHPELLSHTSELGRQTVISIVKKNEMLSVAVQEFTEQGEVNITFMSVKN